MLCSVLVMSQTIDIQGKVQDEVGALPGATIAIMSDSIRINNYAFSDVNGDFWVKNIDTIQSHFIRVRLIGYKDRFLPLDTSYFIFTLVPERIKLNEVKIKAPKISGSGDTTLYVAEAFAKENDVTLGDILNRMPDFNVSDEGKVQYQGKDISNFYIEGSNIMGNKYPVAVKSIHQQDVGSVEVIENHQPIKLFEDMLFSDKTAVNIKLKEKAKRKWAGFLEVGGGLPGLWQGNINLMRFAKKIKTLNTFKSNNTGFDVAAIGKTLTIDNSSFSEDASTFANMHLTHNPFLDKNKTLFNTSHLLSLNSQATLSPSLSLSPQCNIGISELENETWETQDYFLNNTQQFTVVSNTKGLQKQWHIAPIVRLEANTKRAYFSNVLSSDIVHKQTDVAIFGSYPNQKSVEMDYFKLKNDLYTLLKWGEKIIGLKSINSWSRRPQGKLTLLDSRPL